MSITFKMKFMLCLTALLLMSVGWWSAVPVSAGDSNPPYIVSPIPEPDSSNNPQACTVKVGVVDDDSGVDPGSLVLLINGAEPIVEPIIEPSYQGRGYNIYTVLEEMEPGALVTVEVAARDKMGNEMKDTWQFTLETTKFDEKLLSIYPPNNSWLDYDREKGEIVFSWTKGYQPGAYRMKIVLNDGFEGTIDFDQNDIINTFGFVTVRFPVEQIDWSAMNDLGYITWQVAALDRKNGNLLGPYTKDTCVRYYTGTAPLPDTPAHMAIFSSNTIPTFSWRTINSAEGYYVIVVLLDEQGQYTDEVRVGYTPALFNRLPLSASTWETFQPGKWEWTVIGALPGGQFSDYVIYSFEKKGD